MALGKPLRVAQSVLLALLSGYWPAITTKHSQILTVSWLRNELEISKEKCVFIFISSFTLPSYRNIHFEAIWL